MVYIYPILTILSLINLTIHNCGGGISVQACKNITINHTYIYDVKKYGQYISKSDKVITLLEY